MNPGFFKVMGEELLYKVLSTHSSILTCLGLNPIGKGFPYMLPENEVFLISS